jgi:hypothetical protein
VSLTTTLANTPTPKRPKGFQKGVTHRRPTTDEMKAARAAGRKKRMALREQLLPVFANAPDHAMMSFQEWCTICGFSKDTGKRIRGGPDSPQFVKLSKQAEGITVAEHKRWLASRTRGA